MGIRAVSGVDQVAGINGGEVQLDRMCQGEAVRTGSEADSTSSIEYELQIVSDSIRARPSRTFWGRPQTGSHLTYVRGLAEPAPDLGG